MTYKLTAIISGGQTGVDRGAVEAAIALGLGHGGWAPAGWRAEDGEIPAIYRERMRCTSSDQYGMRTRLNIQDSDGTLVLTFDEQVTGGTEYTLKECARQDKNHLHLVLPERGRTRIPDEVRTAVLEWISKGRISILNVAGPRESKEPGIQQAVRDALVWIFEDEGDARPVTSSSETAHALGCTSAVGFNCMSCQRDLCWECEAVLPEGSEIKTAVRWCKTSEACRVAGERGRLGLPPAKERGATVEVVERYHIGPDGAVDEHTIELPAGVFAIDPDPPDLAERRAARVAERIEAEARAIAESRIDPAAAMGDGKALATAVAGAALAGIVQATVEAASDQPPHRGASKQWVSGPLQRTEWLGNDLGDYVVLLYWSKNPDDGSRGRLAVHWVDFELYEITCIDSETGRREFQRRDSVRSPDPVATFEEAETAAEGFVKWDGCTQFDVADVHVDHRKGLDKLFAAIQKCRKLAAREMPGSEIILEYS